MAARGGWATCLVVLLVFCGVSVLQAQRRTRKPKHHVKSSVAKRRLESRLAAVRDRKQKIRSQLHATQRAAKVVVQDLNAVDDRIDAATDRLVETRDSLSRDRARQQQLRRELAAATEKLAADNVAVRKRLRGIYMEGDAPLMGVFIGSVSSGDIASRTYLIKRVAKADRMALDSLKATREQIQRDKQEADRLVGQIEGLVADQRDREQELEDTRDQKRDVLSSLQEKKGELQELLDQFSEDENSIQQQIRAAERASRRTGGGGSSAPPSRFSGRLALPVHARITSTFGIRYHPILHTRRLHAGIDFGAASGTPIHAAAAGVVINAQYMRGFGNVVFIDHGGGIATVYGHCSRLLVRAGQHVAQGETIANVGSTGLATGPHLHFEVRVHGTPVDPRGWL